MYKVLSDEQEVQIVLLYSEGAGLENLAEKFKCAPNTIKRTLLKHDIKLRLNVKPQDSIGDAIVKMYVDEKKSIYRIAKELNTNVGRIGSYLSVRNVKTRSPKEAKKVENPQGPTVSNWRGGRRTIGKGYIYIYSPDHPNATKDKYVMEHRLVMEKKLGRYLESNEIVHHIDGNRGNNKISNLQLCTKGEHTKVHFNNTEKLAEAKEQIKLLKKQIKLLQNKIVNLEK